MGKPDGGLNLLMPKDLFSHQSETYAKYRPAYPQELFDYIFQFVEEKKHAWDCATGNGQAARALADHFEKVEASDISASQIAHALQKPNIQYHVCPAEQTPFSDNSFDLITVATAYHWLNWKKFHDEATRVGKSNAVVAIWSSHLLFSGNENLNQVIRHFYKDITGPYWDPERKHVDAFYSTIEFDFSPLPSKNFELKLNWTRQQLIGFFESWSSVQNYIKQNNSSPVDLIRDDLKKIWSDEETKTIHFPLFLRVGRIVK